MFNIGDTIYRSFSIDRMYPILGIPFIEGFAIIKMCSVLGISVVEGFAINKICSVLEIPLVEILLKDVFNTGDTCSRRLCY